MAVKLKARYVVAALSLVLVQMAPVQAEAAVNIGVDIGFNVPTYPNLVPVPGYPVYYDPAANSNYFFYDGQYWVYQNDNWYTSSWYNGPWQLTGPDLVPAFILRVPVRYYRRPPVYFNGWVADRPPHWGQHWGNDWRARHSDWNRWDRNAAQHAAPLPAYQRQYSGDRYPRQEEQQRALGTQNYHYQPHQTAQRSTVEFKPIGQQAEIVHPAQPRQQARPQAMAHPQPQAQAHQPRNAMHGNEHHDEGHDDHDHH